MANEKKDQIRISGEIAPGVFTGVRRTEEGEHPIGLGIAKEGAPLPPGVDLLQVDPECRDGWHDVRFIFKGPAQVATPKYRDGWDRIFGGKQDVGVA